MFKKFFSIIIILISIISLLIGIIVIIKNKFNVGDKTRNSKFNILNKIDIRDDKEGIGIIYIYGEIFTSFDDSLFGLYKKGSDSIIDQLEELRKDKRVKAIILRINSPGGTIGAAQEIIEEIKLVKKCGIKIISSFGDIAASGAYFIAAHSDLIIANPGTLTGSLSVFIASPEISELMKKLGIKMNVIKSGKYKDILSSFRKMEADEREMIEKLIKDSYEQLVTEVSTGRNIPLEEAYKICDGRLFTGRQALSEKLVDEIGNFQYALKRAMELTGLKGEPVIIKPKKKNIQLFFDLIESKLNFKNLLNNLFEKTSVPLLYKYE